MLNPPLRYLPVIISLLSVVWVLAANAASITTHPNGTTVNKGQSVTLTVGASVSGGASYQWFKDGVRIPSATGSSYNIASCQPWHIGDYTVSVTDSVNTATSNSASVSINGVNSALWKGLMGYYRFDADAGDHSAFGQDLTVSGATLSPDRFNLPSSAFSFNGLGNCVYKSGQAGPDASTCAVHFPVVQSGIAN